MDILIRLHNIPPEQCAPETVQRALAETFGAGMQEVVEETADMVRLATPVGVSGILRSSISTRVTLAPSAAIFVAGEVASGRQAPYAEYVERGTRPGTWRPIAPLKLWARRVLGDERAAYAVRWVIFRRGTRGVWMFRQAAAGLPQRLQTRMEQAAAAFAARLNR
jgi:hypothetical protein